MGDGTRIEWADATWNPIRGCRRVSTGCENCYAERQAHRYSGVGQPYAGLTRKTAGGPRWSGELMLVPSHLPDPLRWQRPRLVFVNSMSDLFFEPLAFEYIAAIFGVMAMAPTHTFQVLTKRPARAVEFFAWLEAEAAKREALDHGEARMFVLLDAAREYTDHRGLNGPMPAAWPLPNVWLGVSAENQSTADERIPLLLSAPAAVRWVSYEPALGPMFLREAWTLGEFHRCPIEGLDEDPATGERFDADPCEGCPGWGYECGAVRGAHLDWIVVGGESGPGARPFDLSWARAMVDACEETPVRVFVKQLGAVPVDTGRDGNTPLIAAGYTPRPVPVELRHPKGGDWNEWDEELCVRQWPGVYPGRRREEG